MPEPTMALTSLLFFTFFFGVKHGFDADHIASIDSIARLQYHAGNPTLSRLSGLLFSVGHGLVVLLAALTLQIFHIDHIPSWLDPLGTATSIAFLLWVSVVNIKNCLRKETSGLTMSRSFQFMMRLPMLKSFAGSLLVGALFAVSFDAFSIAAWFALIGSLHQGAWTVLMVSLIFVAGMVATDMINGLVMARLIANADAFRIAKARRFFALLVASSALIVAGLQIMKICSSRIDHFFDGKELYVGLAVIGSVLVCYWIAQRMNQLRYASLQHPLQSPDF